MTDAELCRHEWIAERAAILEYEAGFDRGLAERLAAWLWDQRRDEDGAADVTGR